MIEIFSPFSSSYTEKGARPKMPSRKRENLPKILCIHKGRGILNNILMYLHILCRYIDFFGKRMNDIIIYYMENKKIKNQTHFCWCCTAKLKSNFWLWISLPAFVRFGKKGTQFCADAGRCDAEASNHLKLFSHTTNISSEYNFI